MYADSYWWARLLFERCLAAIYLIAYLVAANQFRPLLGEHGLQPVPRFLRLVSFREAPSLFHFHYSDRTFGWIAWAGVALSALTILGLPERAPLAVSVLAWVLLWAGYLSVVNIGQTFYSFGWESILIEAGFLAIFLGPDWMQASFIGIVLVRWLLFRVEFGAGLIKLRADPCWRQLTCMDYHYETQPMPNPLSWYAHHLPRWFHRTSVLFNFFVQLIVPFVLFAPQPAASIAALLMILSQAWLVLTGNYAFLNYITIILGLAGFSDGVLGAVFGIGVPAAAPIPTVYLAVLVVLAFSQALMSILPVRNMLSPGQAMNATYNPLHLVGSYGAFGSVTRERLEVIVEGTGDDVVTPVSEWREYEFKGKPGDPRRTPPVVAPYHLRLDWQMWFVPFTPYYYPEWFIHFIGKLLENDRSALGLLRKNPFPDRPPTHIRARFFDYRYSTPEEHRKSGLWWVRTPASEYLPPVDRAALRAEDEAVRLRD